MKSKNKKAWFIAGGVVTMVAAIAAVFSYGGGSMDGVSSLLTGSMENLLNQKANIQPEVKQYLKKHAKIQEILKKSRIKAAAAAKARREAEALAAAAAAEKAKLEAEAAAAAEKTRLETEAAAAAEKARLEAEAKAAAEKARLEAEAAAAAAEKARLEAEAAAAEQARLEAEAAAAEKARLEAEAAAAAEKARLEAEAQAAAEKARLEAEAAAAEKARLEAEAAAAEKARLEAEAAAAEKARLEAEAAAAEKARLEAEAAAAALPKPLALKVVGNSLVNEKGAAIRLFGANRSSGEYACAQGWGIFEGETSLASAQAIKNWNANTVRLPLNEDCWLGINGVKTAYSGVNYQNAVKAYVKTLHEAGLYVILDLHWAAPGNIKALSQQPMADADHSIEFWKQVATTFKDDQGVVFELFNEPVLHYWIQEAGQWKKLNYFKNSNQDPWACWLNGCTFSKYYLSNDSDSNTGNLEWNSAGMQTLVNTVRATGAKNVILVNGIDWANDLTGWLSHKPVDSLNNLAAGWHSYSGSVCKDVKCWDAQVAPVAAQVPVVTTEFGDRVAAPISFLPQLLPWANSKKISYLGWTWNVWPNSTTNVLVKDYAGTPTDGMGTYVRNMFKSQNP